MIEDVGSGVAGSGIGRTRPDSRDCLELVAAYREGLGLAAVAVIGRHDRFHVVTAEQNNNFAADGETIEARWWCRRAAEAERVAARATARRPRREPQDGGINAAAAPHAQHDGFDTVSAACESVARVARQLNVMFQSEREVFDEAMAAVARMDGEIERLQRSGGLKEINKSYRRFRIEASERGEKAPRYVDWMRKYREDLVRKVAEALRSL